MYIAVKKFIESGGHRDINSFPCVITALLLGMNGAAMISILPMYIGTLADHTAFSQQQVGFMGAADLAGTAFSTITAYFWIRSWNWRVTLMIASIVFLLVNQISMNEESFYPLWGLRFISGASIGAAYAICLACLGDNRHPDRYFGIMLTVQVLFGSLLFMVVPTFIQQYGLAAIYSALNVGMLVTIPLILIWLPPTGNTRKKSSTQISVAASIASPMVLLALGGVIFFYIGESSVWGYTERIGVGAGILTTNISFALSASLWASALGSLSASFMGNRFGRTLPIAAGTAITLIGISFLHGTTSDSDYLYFLVANILIGSMWNFTVTYVMSIINEVDVTGRLIVLFIPSAKIGTMIGPAVAGLSVTTSNYMPALIMGGASIVLSCACLISAHTSASRHNASPVHST